MKNRHIYLLISKLLLSSLLLGLIQLSAYGVNQDLINRQRDGSRSTTTHRLTLYDSDGEKISIDDDLVLPYSTRTTCGECHDYEKIKKGWHFNYINAATMAYEKGEPWILSDGKTGTQIPISDRDWKGTWRSGEIGLSPWKFIESFGSHLPGGGIGEIDTDPLDIDSRWHLSGKLEINCLACHNGSPFQDQSEWAIQIDRQNFAWASTAASGLATVYGSVTSLPDTYSIYDGRDPDDPEIIPPYVEFNPAWLDKKNKAFFDIKAKPLNDRCYFCHSSKPVSEGITNVWVLDEDVHLSAGLTCVDCHRNGLDHMITRGRESEIGNNKKPNDFIFSCKECHFSNGSSNGVESHSGRLGAPYPRHKGLPPIHFDKMTCTSCHSGQKPKKQVGLMRTSRAHKLGVHTNSDDEQDLPYIYSPVFMKQSDGKIAPHNILWPSFWGNMTGDKVTPILSEKITKAVGGILQARINDVTGTEKILTLEKIEEALVVLNVKDKSDSNTIYISGGKLYSLDYNNKIKVSEHMAASPYFWPIAHEVRPAIQSLGYGGCTDCHKTNTPFFFGTIEVTSSLQTDNKLILNMYDLQEHDVNFEKLFGYSFGFRPMYKIIVFTASGLLAALLLLYGLLCLHRFCILIGRKK